MIAFLLFLILCVLVLGGFLHIATEALAFIAAIVIVALVLIVKKILQRR